MLYKLFMILWGSLLSLKLAFAIILYIFVNFLGLFPARGEQTFLLETGKSPAGLRSIAF